jgi:hypothetical protein
VRVFLFTLALIFPTLAHPQTTPPPNDAVSLVLRELERILVTNDEKAFAAISLQGSALTSEDFLVEWLQPGVTRAVVQERMRAQAEDVSTGEGYDLYVDALAETGRTGRVGTWLLRLRRDPKASAARPWRISSLHVLTTVRGLHRLFLNPDRQFTVTNFALSAEDFELRLPQGYAFVAEAESGITGIVLIGRGEVIFSPAPQAEKGQVKIYSGSETLQRRFTWLYLRAHPVTLDRHIDVAAFQSRAVDQRDFRRADVVFQENLALSFAIDLGDLSRERWSVVPKIGDLVAEIQTDRAHLTYMRAASDPEDIRFIDRDRERTISIYASRAKLAARGPFYSEDDQAEYDIVHYDIEASLDPRREWIEGKATMLMSARGEPTSTLMLSLAEPFAIRSVVSRRLGYLMALRVSGQDNVIINLPQPLLPNTLLDLEVTYAGRLPAVAPEREALDLAAVVANATKAGPAADLAQANEFTIPPLPSYIYTGRSRWYPQGQFSDYATGTLLLRVPQEYSTVASGALDEGYPKMLPVDAHGIAWKQYRFSATQPARYFGWATSRFVHVSQSVVSITPPAEGPASQLEGVSYSTLDLSVESSGMLQRRARDLAEQTREVLQFYGSLIGDLPFQTFTLAVVERTTPGGHSPPYFAALSQPPPATPVIWRTDPAYFDGFPEFFLAHETAHQWWGQAVGWKNYHEQWLSEGMSQYFAALFAEHRKRQNVFDHIVSQMTRWTLDRSDQGPVYLGYRLGHIKNDSRIFRALVYNKGALSLHMLRRLLGDQVFFRGLRRFYTTWRFKKAGTEDLRVAFEAEAGRPLARFFERWIYGSTLPRMKFSYTTERDAITARFEQMGELFDVPVTVTVQYANSSVDVVVPVTEAVVSHRIPITSAVRSVAANRDNAAPVIFVR